MSKISEILVGWGNAIKEKLGLLDNTISEEAKRRMVICDGCEVRNLWMCDSGKTGKDKLTGEMKNGCGCIIFAKATSPDSKCPLNKW